MTTLFLLMLLWLACGLYSFICWQDYAAYSEDAEVQTWSWSYLGANLLYGPINVWRYYMLKRDLKVLHMLGEQLEKESE